MSKRLNRSVVVLGAGIQGCCTALELARRGFGVTLLERDAMAMNRASLRNEGKIHLGLVYANESSMQTARLQLEGALSFRALLKQWIGAAADDLGCSTPFHYLVACDSLLSPEKLEEHYVRLEACYHEQLLKNTQLDYLGTRPEHLYRKLTQRQLRSRYNLRHLGAGYSTAELSITPEQLAYATRKAIADAPNVRFCPGRFVESVERSRSGFLIKGMAADGRWVKRGEQVVNATWDGRPAIDRSMGIECGDGLLHRLKYRVIAELPDALRRAPSVTMVIGPYGDVVIRPDGTAYLSWYPLALRGWSHELEPPAAWQEACRGVVSRQEFKEVSARVMGALDEWYPGIAQARPLQVDAGVILAYGRSDVSDKSSGLHNRTVVGVTSVDGYHSLDAGKLTTAPMFAMIAADHVTAG